MGRSTSTTAWPPRCADCDEPWWPSHAGDLPHPFRNKADAAAQDGYRAYEAWCKQATPAEIALANAERWDREAARWAARVDGCLRRGLSDDEGGKKLLEAEAMAALYRRRAAALREQAGQRRRERAAS